MQVESLPPDEHALLVELKDWIELKMGISYRPGALPILYSRLHLFCERQNIQGLRHLHQALNNGRGEELSLELAQSVSTTHTHFFREPESLNFFLKEALSRFRSEAQLRIWSAASSSGQEAYTLAIMMAEALGLKSAQERIHILGTDINARMIRSAELGLYDHSQLDDVPQELKTRYFLPVGMGQYQIHPDIRAMCTFRRINLHTPDWPFQQAFHSVFCRNVLYYFQAPQQELIVNKIHNHVTEGGLLITSITESLLNMNTAWRKLGPAVYSKGA